MGLLSDLLGIGEFALNIDKYRYEKSKDAHLTGAQVEQNEWSAQQAQEAYNRELAADSSKYQRQVADLKAAGLNPMLAAGASAGSVHSSPAASGSPVSSSLGSVSLGNLLDYSLQKKQLALQRELISAQKENIEADTEKKRSEVAGLDIDNDIKALTKSASIEAASLQNDLTRGKIKQIDAGLDEISARISKMAAETDSETEKASLYAAQRIYTNANARQIIELLPYEKALRSAKTENERQAALLAAAHTAYQNKLIDDGYIDSFIRNMSATADSAEYKAELDEIKAALRTGSNVNGVLKNGGVSGHILQSLTIFLDNLNPLGSLVK